VHTHYPALCTLATARGFLLNAARSNVRVTNVSNALVIKLHAFQTPTVSCCFGEHANRRAKNCFQALQHFTSTCANMFKQELSKNTIVPLMRMEHDAGTESTALNLRLKRAIDGLRKAQAYSKPELNNLFQRECISQLQKGLESRRSRSRRDPTMVTLYTV
jgi:hypothetical protein